MKLIDTEFRKDFNFGEVVYVKPADEEDMKQGIDTWIGGIPLAWRRRRISIKKYGEISIRHLRASGAKTEYDKLLDGSFKALIYVFQFTDAVIICTIVDIVMCLKEKKYRQVYNSDGITSAIYIKLRDVPHLEVKPKPV